VDIFLRISSGQDAGNMTEFTLNAPTAIYLLTNGIGLKAKQTIRRKNNAA